WTNHIDVTSDKAKIAEIWQRFPKFILGFVVTFLVGLCLALGTPADVAAKVPAAIGEANTFRVIFFILTFLDRRSLQLQEAVAGGYRKTPGRLRLQLFRFRDLGRPADFLAFLCRHQAAAGRLIPPRSIPCRKAISVPSFSRRRPSLYYPSRRSLSALASAPGSFF